MNERRTVPRKNLADAITARTRTSATVHVLDISLGGMRVLSEDPLSPRKEIVAWLPTPKGELRLRAHVLRCRAKFLDKPLPSGAVLVYDAGLEFSGLTEHELSLIRESYLDVKSSPSGNDTKALLELTQAINQTARTA